MDRCVLQDVYDFWFSGVGDSDVLPEAKVRYWMMGGEETDRAIRDRFGHRVAEAEGTTWQVASLSRREAVALVVLLDQFPRNVFRTSREAFAYDPLARALVRDIENTHSGFTTAELFFLGLPYVHHEDIASQDRAVFLAADLLARSPEEGKTILRFNLDQAIRHREIIQRFGRFPHRNEVLGRSSTLQELEFMASALRGRGF